MLDSSDEYRIKFFINAQRHLYKNVRTFCWYNTIVVTENH